MEVQNPQDLESISDKSKRFRSIRISQLALFCSAIGFSAILTGVYPYMKQLTPGLTEKERLSRFGIVVAIQPLGQTIFSPILGFLTTKFGTKKIVLTASIAYILGNALYSTLSVFPEDYRYALLITSRFTVGMAGGYGASVRSYLASATFVSERTTQMSIGKYAT